MSDSQKSIIDLAKGIAPGNEADGSVPKRPGLEQLSETIAPQSTQDLQSALDTLLSKSRMKQAWISIDLPSKDLENIKPLNVKLRPFRYEDERKLRSATSISESASVIDEIINSCMQGASLREVTLADKNFILYKLRQISYGNEYEVVMSCEGCGSKNQLVVKMSSLDVNRATPSMKNPFPVKLPDSEVTVMIREMMAKDESVFANPEDLTENLWKIIESVGDYNDRMIIQNFMTQCTARDISYLRNNIFTDRMGIDTTVKFRCNTCSQEQSMTLPINESFFSAS